MAYDTNNVFAKILRGELPAQKVYEDADTLAFMDIMPRCEGHMLVIPKTHQPNVVALGESSPRAVVDLFEAVGAVAKLEGLEAGYRSVFNTGALAQQEVFHAHVHVLGGRAMTWPPG